MDTLTTPALFREKDRDQDAANNAEDSINRSIRGIFLFFIIKFKFNIKSNNVSFNS